MFKKTAIFSLLALALCTPSNAQSVGKIAFFSDRDGNREIYIMDEDGTNPVNLTNNPAEDFRPAFSPDGRRIAFVSDRDGTQRNGQTGSGIYAVDIDGTNLVNLTGHLDGLSRYAHPTWSPDGRRIAFSAWTALNTDIYAVDIASGNLTRLTDDPALDDYPSWSPEGNSIVYSSSQISPFTRLFSIDLDSGVSTQVSAGSADLDPIWSSDGAWLVFARFDVLAGGTFELQVVQLGQDEPVQLTNNQLNDWGAGWSPDGSRIVFASQQDGQEDIYTMGADGADPVKLTDHPANDGQPKWALVPVADTAIEQISWGQVKLEQR
ncbi:MAG: hypothetical protein GKR89_35610 [Candidatus Latescibacteria bacterium]|nr:hypothetical protein [Candidatus Latescibacterota bacterium]